MLPWEFSERILRVASLSDLERDAAQYSRLLGFEHHAYVLKMPVPVCDQDAGDYQLHNLNGEAWQALYGGWNDEERQSTDVRVRHVRAGLPATSWSVDAGVSHTHNDIARSAQGILRTAHTVGLRGGVTVPIFSPGASWGLMTFSTQNTSNLRDLAPLVAPALYFASCLNASVRRLLGTPIRAQLLSEREREILHWVAVGKSSWDISRILSLSDHTVNYHLQRAAKKLNVHGRQAACARALALDLIAL
jgi:DNA-binding CsgD family transcriptional regulator